MDCLPSLIPITPVVASANATLPDIEVFRIIDILVWARLYTVYDTWLEIYENGSGYVSRIVTLVVKYVLAVAAFCREIL